MIESSKPHVMQLTRNIVELLKEGHHDAARTLIKQEKDNNGLAEDEYLALEGFILAVERKYEKAIAVLEQVRKKDASVLTTIGYCHFRLYDLDKALNTFIEATNVDASHAIAWYNRAVVHHKRGELEEAEKAMQVAEMLLEVDRERWSSHAQRLLVPATQSVDIKSSLMHIIRPTLDESDPMFWYRLSLMFQEKALFGEALNAINRAISLKQEDAVLWTQSGWLLYLLERFDEAEKSFLRALELDENNVVARFFLALTYKAQNNHQQSIRTLETLLKSNVDLSSVYVSLIESALRINDLKMAEQYSDDFLERHPGNDHARYLKALVLMKKGNPRDAVPILESLSHQNPHAPQFQTQLGNAYRMLGDLKAARQTLETVISEHPNHVPALLNLALLLRDLGLVNEAISYYERIVAMQPTLASAWNDFGILLASSGQKEQAKDAFRKAIEHGRLAQFRFNLGKLLYEEGSIDEAISYLEEAIQLDPGYLKPRLYLTCCYQKKEDMERFNKMIEEIMERKPELLKQLPCTISS